MADSGGWLSDSPAELIGSGRVTLLRAKGGDCAELVEAVNASHHELRLWMPWAQEPATEASIQEFLSGSERAWDAREAFQFAIRGQRGELADALLGFCGLHSRVGVGGLDIGYWVRSDCTGRGVATSAARAATESALGLEGVSRVEIHCDAANHASAAIPPKLGYRLDRTETRIPISPGETDELMVWVRSLS
jgi:RimJ/RimL family protein N-acetyltransferase